MPIASSNYWDQIHVFTPKDVMKDEEGVRIFKVLANNITCLLSAKKNNIEMFEALTGSMTNFIRD